MIRLLALQARRDRITLTAWVVGLAVLLLVTVQASHAEYGNAADRRQVLVLALATPVLLAFRGIVDGDSFGSAVHFQSYTWVAAAVGMMNTFLAVRHGRADEAAGRRELIDGTPVRRLAAPSATLVLALVANLLFGALAAVFEIAGGLDATGAVLTGAGLALTGLAFLGLGMLVGEAMPTPRGANGVAVVLVLLAYALRAAGDALGRPDVRALTLRPAVISAFSPIGWGEQLKPFTNPTTWPLAALAGLAAVLIGAAFLVHLRREPGASIVRQRPGPASGRIPGPIGLALRLQLPAAAGWAIGAGALAAVTPNLVDAASRIPVNDVAVTRIVQSLGHGRADLATQFTAAILLLVGVLASAAGVQTMLRAREEEVAGRAEAVLAGSVSRVRWLASWTIAAIGTVALVLAAAAAAIALGSLAQGQPDRIGREIAQTFVQAPSALALTGVAALLVAVLPRAAIPAAWAVFSAAALVGLFGGALDLPDGVVRYSPVGAVPALPTHDWASTWAMAAAAVLLIALASAAIRRRAAA